jgi:hypothetical protein
VRVLSDNNSRIATSSGLKRTIHLSEVLDKIDSTKVIYPGGVIANIRESKAKCETAKRVELFAEDKKDKYGILRTLFVAYSSKRRLLEIAESSSSVIEVRAFAKDKLGVDVGRHIVEDRLVLKRNIQHEAEEACDYRPKTPSIFVPLRWGERMSLNAGDKIIISNPIEEYSLPPPNV